MNEIENIVRLYIAFPLWNYLQKKKTPDRYADKQRQQLRTLFKDNEILVLVVCAFVES